VNRIRLDTPEACRVELERCSSGLAWLDHAYSLARDAVDDAEQTYNAFEADAAVAARKQLGKGATATEVKGAITSWVLSNEHADSASIDLYKARAMLDKLERYFRSLEKRLGAAQSAAKQHDAAPGDYGQQRGAGI